MTPQQAGVSAEALRGAITIALLFMRHSPECDGGQGDPVNGPQCACGMYQARQNVEATLLATAPPKQAAQTNEQLQAELQRVYKLVNHWHGEAQRLERELAEKSAPPQAASDGARSPNDEIHFQEGRLLGLTEGMHKCEELLAAHDQKVRAEVIEPAKITQDSTWRDGWRWTCQHGNESALHYTKMECGCELVVRAPAASKPEAEP